MSSTVPVLTGAADMHYTEVDVGSHGDTVGDDVVRVTEGVKVLSTQAYKDCARIARVHLPPSLSEVGRRAFDGCTALTEIILPSSVATIGKAAFRNCHKLEHLVLPPGLTKVLGSTFENCIRLKHVEIPSSVVWIGDRAFAGCQMLTSITIPEHSQIGKDAFKDCPVDVLELCQQRMKRHKSSTSNSRSAVGEAEIVKMEAALNALKPSESYVPPTPTKHWVDEVPGAFVLQGCLTVSECEVLAKEIHGLHDACAWEEGSRKMDGTQLEKTQSKHAVASPRRQSQHHIPCHVSPSAMSGLYKRIAVFVPKSAGPDLPATFATALQDELAISTFLRCYRYQSGDTSTPHYDRSQTVHSSSGHLTIFSAYSVLLYLTDDFEDGGTTFFRHDPAIRITRSGLTPVKDDISKLAPIVSIKPKVGDVLIFPHGRFSGCHPNPLHEGSVVRGHQKLLIRTDLMFNAPPPKSKLNNMLKKK